MGRQQEQNVIGRSNLPTLALRNVFKYLNEAELKRCRLVCRYWNASIIASGFITNTADFYFHLKVLLGSSKPRLKFSFSPNINVISKFQLMQDVFCENQVICGPSSEKSLRIVNFECFPEFGTHLVQSFGKLIANISYLSLTMDGCPKGKVTATNLLSILDHTHQLKKLQISSDLLYLLKDIQQDSPDFKKVIEFFDGITDLEILLGNSIKRKKLEYLAILVCQVSNTLKRLKVKGNEDLSRDSYVWPPLLHDFSNYVLNTDSVRQSDPFFRFIMKKHLEPLTHLSLDIPGFQLPESEAVLQLHQIISGFLIKFAGMKSLFLRIDSYNLETALAVVLPLWIEAGCEVRLHLKIIYDTDANRPGNNFLLRKLQPAETLQKLTLTFTKKCKPNFPVPIRAYLPHNDGNDLVQTMYGIGINLIRLNNLKYLRIEMENSGTNLVPLRKYNELADVAPNLTELIVIQGPYELYQSNWRIWKQNLMPSLHILDWFQRYYSYYGRWIYDDSCIKDILDALKNLEVLVLWTKMGPLPPANFVPTTSENYTSLKLRKLSIRGAKSSTELSGNPLMGLQGMQNLKELEIIGNQKIEDSDKKQLMQQLSTLQSVKFAL